MLGAKPELKVSVFSDYICPFCYIGSRRLLRLDADFDLKVNWCGLEIHPETPAAGMPIAELGYPSEQWSRMMAVLEEMATAEGIDFSSHDFTTNSRKALLLSEAAKQGGREQFYALHERLFSAFFTQKQNIGDEPVLRALARESGVGDEIVESAWRDPRHETRLKLNLQWAVALGVNSTPSYVIGTDVLIGAVPLEDLRAAAEKALQKEGVL